MTTAETPTPTADAGAGLVSAALARMPRPLPPRPTVLACAVVSLGGLQFGYHMTVLSGVLTFQSFIDALGDSETLQQALTASLFVGALLGCTDWRFGVSRAAEQHGRRAALLLCSLLFVSGAAVAAFAPVDSHALVIAAARVLCGMGVGVANSVVPVYNAEVAPVHYRGALVFLYQLAICVGIYAAQSINAAYGRDDVVLRVDVSGTTGAPAEDNWRAPLRWSLAPALLMLVMMAGGYGGRPFVPESPRWLATHGYMEGAERAREMLGMAPECSPGSAGAPAQGMRESGSEAAAAKGDGVPQRWSHRQERQERERDAKASGASDAAVDEEAGGRTAAVAVVSRLRDSAAELDAASDAPDTEAQQAMDDASFKHRLGIGFRLQVLQQLSGINGVLFYAVHIFEQIAAASGGDAREWVRAGGPLRSAKLVGLANLLATVAAVFLVDRCGRRRLYLTATPVMIAGLLLLATASSPSLSLLAVFTFVSAFAVSHGPLAFLVASELYPQRLRSRASAANMVVNMASTLLVGLCFLSVKRHVLGDAGVFYFFAACLAVGLYWIYRTVPETRGRSLEEIGAVLLSPASSSVSSSSSSLR